MNPTLIIALSSMTLLAVYFAVRMDKVRPILAFVVGGVMTSVFFFLYAMSRGNTPVRAIIVGPLLGFVFTGLSVAMGLFYRNAVAPNVTQQRSTSVNPSGIEPPKA